MRSIEKPEDLDYVSAQGQAVLYFYVDWSVYAVRGRQILEVVEKQLPERPDLWPQFWLADVSDMNSPVAFIGEWLKKQEREDMKMYNMIACGSGSVAWLREGEVIDFEISVSRAGSDQLVERTKRLFHNHAT